MGLLQKVYLINHRNNPRWILSF